MSSKMNKAHILFASTVCLSLMACSRNEQEEAVAPVAPPPHTEGVQSVYDLPAPTDEELAQDGLSREQWNEMTNALSQMETYVKVGISRDQIDTKLTQLLQAELPAETTNLWGLTLSLFTQVTMVRFTTTQNGLYDFLASASRLPDSLTPNLRTIHDKASDKRPFWRPDELTAVSGWNTTWQTEGGANFYSCAIMAGTSGRTNQVDVYLRITWEVMKKDGT